ncbi:MATE family efflux transporter [Ancylomarina salipaludis]|uniref:MATE family efflux transporter n=1 Tax=Ancylomarina salipaludis TaxID=2501299 RepID=UPI0013E946E1|nr:MATE family efflux transporter [Ancylomarina salipaludis]
MSHIKDLTSGNIFSQILKLAIPIIATSFVQMAYNMIDMAWLGNVGSETVGAVGMASYLVWLGSSLMYIPKIGAEVCISQSIGRKNMNEATAFTRNALGLSFILSIGFAILVWLFTGTIISLFQIESDFVNQTAFIYLRIVAIGMPFTYSNITLSGIYNGTGKTKTPFFVNAIGLIVNIIIDPILIFGWGAIPAMGAEGAAIATVSSQLLVFGIFIFLLKGKYQPLSTKHYLGKLQKQFLKPIVKIGGPVTLQSACFALLAIVLARVMNDIAQGNSMPLSVQSIGSQVEALSWMTALGFSSALGTFTGQNYGAKRWDRIQKGFFVTLGIASVLGLISTALFYFFGAEVFSLFIKQNEPAVLKMGIVYLIILSYSQVFMCVEITATGAFNGIGKAMPPSIIGIIGNLLRIPFAFIFAYSLVDILPLFQEYLSHDSVPVTAVWWGLTLSSILKGSFLFLGFIIMLLRHPENDHELPFQKKWISLLPNRLRQQAVIVSQINTEEESEQ